MNGEKRLNRAEVERIAREVIGQSPIRSESPDTMFLAGFRRKLAAFRKPEESLVASISRLSWNLAPVTALATLILGVGLLWGPSQPNPAEEIWERVLYEIADDQKTDVSQDLLVEAVLLGSNGR